MAIVADGHALTRFALAEILRRKFGFRLVVEVSSFVEAFDQLGRAPDAAFATLDLEMPGMDGAASLAAIRAEFPGPRLAVVSASERREDILLALGAGVHGYIPKTFQVTEIAAALRTILDGNIFVPPVLASRAFDAAPDPAAGPDHRKSPGVTSLSPRQLDVLNILALGKSNKEIAHDLHLAEGTVKVHVNALFRALGVQNRVGAVAAMKRPQVVTGPRLIRSA